MNRVMTCNMKSILKHACAMKRLYTCFWIHKGFCVIDGGWRLAESARNQFNLPVIGANIASGINARNIGFHAAIDYDGILLNLKAPFLDWSEG